MGADVGDGEGADVATDALRLGSGEGCTAGDGAGVAMAIATARMVGVSMLLRYVRDDYLDDFVADDDEFPVDSLFGAKADVFVSPGIDIADVIGTSTNGHQMLERVSEPDTEWVGTMPVWIAGPSDQYGPHFLVIGDADEDVLHFRRPHRKLEAVRVRAAARMNAFAKEDA